MAAASHTLDPSGRKISVNASDYSFVNIGHTYQSGASDRQKLLDILIPNWRSTSSLQLHWDHEQAKKKHSKDTGTWFLNLQEYKSWESTPRSLLWVHGITGVGKTILSSIVIEHLRNHFDASCNRIAGYYFKATEVQKSGVSQLLCSLLLQLLPPTEELPLHLKKLCGDPSQYLSDRLLKSHIEKLLEHEGHTYIIIDALDECDARFSSGETSESEKLSHLLHWICESPSKLHLLVTSRDGGLPSLFKQDLNSLVQKVSGNINPHRIVDLQSHYMIKHVKSDIEKFVESELERWNQLPNRCWINAEKSSEIADKVNKQADGMFRLAACHLDLIQRKGSWEEAKNALNHLPPELPDVYDKIFEDIEYQGQTETAINLLRLLLFAKRPLKLQEINELTMTDSEGFYFSTAQKAQGDDYVKFTLGSFVNVAEDGAISFAHQSVLDYLLSDKAKGGLFLRIAECHRWIAKCCLSYIRFCANFKTGVCSPKSFAEEVPFFEYTSNNWYKHAAEAWTDCDRRQNDIPLSTGHRERDGLPQVTKTTTLEGSHRALISWSEGAISWLRQKPRLDYETYCDALNRLLCQGYENCVRLLLEGSDPCYAKDTAILHAAISGAYTQMLQTLLGHNAEHANSNKSPEDSNARKSSPVLENWKLLSQKTIVMSLINSGIDINSRDYSSLSWTPLHMAAFQGNLELTELFFDKHVNEMLIDNVGRTALHIAASQGHAPIIRLWMQRGFEVNAKDRLGWTALDYSVMRSAIEISKEGGLTYFSTSDEYSKVPSGFVHPMVAEGEDCDLPQAILSNSDAVTETVRLLSETVAGRSTCWTRSFDTQPEVSDHSSFVSNDNYLDDEPDNTDKQGKGPKSYDHSLIGHAHVFTCASGELFSVNPPSSSHEHILLQSSPFRRTSISAVSLDIKTFPERPMCFSTRSISLRIGKSLMEEIFTRSSQTYERKAIAASIPPFDDQGTYYLAHLDEAHVHYGTIEFTRANVHVLNLSGGVSTIAYCLVNDLIITGGLAILGELTACKTIEICAGQLILRGVTNAVARQIDIQGGTVTSEASLKVVLDQITVYRGSVTFASSTIEANQITIYGGTVTFEASSKAILDQITVYGGSITFASSTVEANQITLYGGSVTFEASSKAVLDQITIYQGLVIFAALRIILDETAIYGGYMIFKSYLKMSLPEIASYSRLPAFLSVAELKRFVSYGGSLICTIGFHLHSAVVYGGCINFQSADSVIQEAYINEAIIYGGQLWFFTHPKIKFFTIFGGRIYLLNDIFKELLILLQGSKEDIRTANVDARGVIIQNLDMHGGWMTSFNLSSPMTLYTSRFHGGFVDLSRSPNILTLTAKIGNDAVIRLLVDKAPNYWESTVTEGDSALEVAAAGGHEIVVRLLLERYSELYFTSGIAERALQDAELHGHEVVVQALEEAQRLRDGGLQWYTYAILSWFYSLL